METSERRVGNFGSRDVAIDESMRYNRATVRKNPSYGWDVFVAAEPVVTPEGK